MSLLASVVCHLHRPSTGTNGELQKTTEVEESLGLLAGYCELIVVVCVQLLATAAAAM